MLGVGFLGLTAGSGVFRIHQNESDKKSLSSGEIQQAAIRRLEGKRPLFGTLPDFELPNFDPWQRLQETKDQVGALDFVGFFPKIEYFENDDWRNGFLSSLERSIQMGAEPVLGLGYVQQVEGHHPFDDRVKHLRKEHFLGICKALRSLGSPVTVRLFFEMNLSAYCYGTQRELSWKQHAQGYIHSFGEFVNAVQSTGAHVKTSFNPFVQNFYMPYSFTEHWPVVDGQLLADSAGLDGYHLFPGKGQWQHPYYWIPGQHTAQDTFFDSFRELDQLCNNQIPWYIWELGSLCRDSAFLSEAFWLSLACGGDGAMHFDYDKTHHNRPHEGEWFMTADNMTAYNHVLFSAA